MVWQSRQTALPKPLSYPSVCSICEGWLISGNRVVVLYYSRKQDGTSRTPSAAPACIIWGSTCRLITDENNSSFDYGNQIDAITRGPMPSLSEPIAVRLAPAADGWITNNWKQKWTATLQEVYPAAWTRTRTGIAYLIENGWSGSQPLIPVQLQVQ